MPDTTREEDLTYNQRAARVRAKLTARVAGSPTIAGKEVTPEALDAEVIEELRILDSLRDFERIHREQAHEEALAEKQQLYESVAVERNQLRSRTAQLEAQLSRTSAALREALAKATQVGSVTGTVAEWEKRLANMPPLARFEIEAWRSAALRRLATIGTTQADVMIARLADVSLEPFKQATADAETH